ncbi:hypothetical protein [Acetivibrio cellulolyticus]|uniref:hypothetical protein n=1 Tax=Acetivibrio cellulolyticus TaxID=35830 RepID=UPI0001E30559|nr:hypothetical protein [Acetivibrio cellulolyticus]
MFKKILSGLILAVLLVSSVPAMAAQGYDVQSVESYSANDNMVFERTVTVTEKGGSFEVGFVTVNFPKDFLTKDQYPKTFTLRVCAKDGEVGIEASPDTNNFLKPVKIKVDAYTGFLYDEVTNQNIFVNVKKQTIIATHFSWYRFR